MLENVSFTAVTVPELLRENQQLTRVVKILLSLRLGMCSQNETEVQA